MREGETHCVPAAGDLALAAFAVAGTLVAGPAAPRLYPRRLHEAFSASIAGVVVDAGADLEVAFDLPAAADFVRIGIPAVPGHYRVGRILIDGVAVVQLAARRVESTAAAPAGEMDDDSLRIEARSGRPQVDLDVRGLVVGPARMVVSIRRELPPDLVSSELGGMLDALGRDVRHDATGVVESVSTLSRRLQEQAVVLRASDVRAMDAANEARDLGHRQLAVLAESLAEGAKAVAAQEVAREALADLLERQAEAGRTAAGLIERLDALHAQVRATSAATASTTVFAVDAVRGDVAALRADVEQLTALVREGMLRRVLRRFGLMRR